jgi:Asp-tRNA(Asn)/Glu-tRNA(Gln) amidotransferase A subunit family amidase
MPSTVRRSRPPETALDLGAVALRDRLAAGALKAADLAEAAIARIEATEPELRAWAWFDPDFVRAQGKALDAHRATGRPVGALHGVPVGIKDIIDTARIPTENGTPLDAGRVPREDAFVVARLKAAGALILGKTATTELAFFSSAPTRNPANPAHTPGGSSAGSAAAVAAGQTPLAVGTQTAGSVIRPAAFCGVVGFKPSFGAVPRTGILAQSPSLDTVGVFARSVPDAALLAETLYGHDPRDRATAPAPPPRLLEIATAPPPLAPVFAFVRPPGWDDADPDTRAALEELAAHLGDRCFEAPLPGAFAQAAEIRERVNLAELAKCYHPYERRGRDALSAPLRAAIDAGKAIPARDYIAALDWPDVLNAGVEELLARCDVILAPAAPGPAPEGLGATGSPIFNGLWTLCGMPAVTIPVLQASNGLPMGVQLVGRRGDDGRLLRTARWLMEHIAGDPEGGAR